MSNHAIKHLSKNLILSQKPGCDIIPLFRTKVSEHEERGSFVDLTSPTSYSNYLLNLISYRCGIQEDSYAYTLLNIFCNRPQRATDIVKALKEVYVDLYLASELHPDLPEVCTIFNSMIQEITKESHRYSHSKSKPVSNIFWPNPSHPKYPRDLNSSEPFVQKHQFVTPDTVIATAGSCFAYEIARYLQSEGYNYLVTEKPGNGVYSSDYSEGDQYVPFSANFGILFNSPSLKQLADKAFGRITLDKILVQRDGYYHDPYRETIYFKTEKDFLNNYNSHINQ